jgi:hypothetical protein
MTGRLAVSEDLVHLEDESGYGETQEQHRAATAPGTSAAGGPRQGYLHAVLTGVGIGIGERLTTTALARRHATCFPLRRRERA